MISGNLISKRNSFQMHFQRSKTILFWNILENFSNFSCFRLQTTNKSGTKQNYFFLGINFFCLIKISENELRDGIRNFFILVFLSILMSLLNDKNGNRFLLRRFFFSIAVIIIVEVLTTSWIENKINVWNGWNPFENK
jgi:hypothetical protein